MTDKEKSFALAAKVACNKKGHPSFLSRLRLRRVASLGKSWRRTGVRFTYVFVPKPGSDNSTCRMYMQLALMQYDADYDGVLVLPDAGTSIPIKEQKDFVRAQMEAHGHNHFVLV